MICMSEPALSVYCIYTAACLIPNALRAIDQKHYPSVKCPSHPMAHWSSRRAVEGAMEN